MPRTNNIVKFHLESRARELYSQEISLSDIASVLSSESKQNISKLTVFRYFETESKTKVAVIEKKAELQLAVTEAEISTIEDRQTVIKGLLTIAANSENEHNKILAFRTATEALDSLDKRLGKLTTNSGITNNINVLKLSEVPTEQLLRMIDVTTQ